MKEDTRIERLLTMRVPIAPELPDTTVRSIFGNVDKLTAVFPDGTEDEYRICWTEESLRGAAPAVSMPLPNAYPVVLHVVRGKGGATLGEVVLAGESYRVCSHFLNDRYNEFALRLRDAWADVVPENETRTQPEAEPEKVNAVP